MDWDEVAPIVSSAKDVVLMIAGGVTAWVAVHGLNKWRHEMSGKNEYEAARNLIKATYRVREALRSARSPVMWSNEFPESGHDADGFAHAYTSRFKAVIAALEEFETAGLEAEALWGATIKSATSELAQCVREVYVAMEAIVENKRENNENFKADPEFGKKMRAAAHESSDNAMTKKILAAVKAIEDEVRPRMAPK
jgi:hypothetical protein